MTTSAHTMLNEDYASAIGEVASRVVAQAKPVAVYRLQFNREFTFRDAASLVPYLHKLGITHVYASPYLKARPGSRHGYDVTDHNMLGPEIGTPQDLAGFVQGLHKYGMGQILDFVPNHVGLFDNPKWQDVLENGPASPYARFFDIDWTPASPELQHKVLLPVLAERYGKVLEAGLFSLVFDHGAFCIAYEDNRFPVDPATASMVLEPCLERLEQMLGTGHPDVLELQSIVTACRKLPGREETRSDKVARRQRGKESLKSRLWQLYQRSGTVRAAIEEKIVAYRAGDGSGRGKLHKLLEKQAYRLSYWRVAAEEINYRRFFDINELVGIRMEDPTVFAETHRLVRELLCKGDLNGLRIDHVDGLFDPTEYLWRLQKAHWVDRCLQEAPKHPQLAHLGRETLEGYLSERFERERRTTSDAPSLRPLYVVLEKILGQSETLREDWPVYGTTGYEFMAALNQLFIDSRHRRALLDTYRQFTGNSPDFPDTVYQCKNHVMETSLRAEVDALARQLAHLAEASWMYRDFTFRSLRKGVREVIACFPVYRTYLSASGDAVDERDRAVIDRAIAEARRRNPALEAELFDFLRNVLLLQYSPDMSEEGRCEQRQFVMRFQQVTGPVMAKGMEDTAFYIYNPLTSLNDVGGNPGRMAITIGEFHRQNRARRRQMPYSLICTSTHDSKRGEDVRARINVLPEIPDDWQSALKRWQKLNRNRKLMVGGRPIPDGNEEYLLYQTLLGTCPLQWASPDEAITYRQRVQQYMLKALREAKINTSWTDPDNAYEKGMADFVSNILEESPDNRFLADFQKLNRVVATCGMYNSLSQVVLKLFSPGVPDIYQGNELWAYNLTDPDNRRPVDFARRMRLLADLEERMDNTAGHAGLVKKLLATGQDGRIKLYLTWQSLRCRRDRAALFREGTYTPLKVVGTGQQHICAFAWRRGREELIVIVPRFFVVLTRKGTVPPVGAGTWDDTFVVLGRKATRETHRNIFTGELVRGARQGDRQGLPLAEVFATLPWAALERMPEQP
ncbi:MAG: malto-oligosyltrehalose synthase [Chloroflexi bacterium]|nr:malto-oligosyltrehalose synthase [Chloroflexota bacterium]